MVDIVAIDHVTEGLAQLPSQWDNKPVIRGVLGAWLAPLNKSEADLIHVRDAFDVNVATGASLSIIGGYFAENRNGRADDEYRNAILSIIAASNGSGTPTQLIELFTSISKSDDIRYWEHYPLALSMLAVGSEVVVDDIIHMDKATAASVEYAALMYDVNAWAWLPKDKQQVVSNTITNTPDNIIMNDGGEDFNVAADILVEDLEDGFLNSSFVDETIPDPEETGYGKNYGNSYGGANFITSIFVEASVPNNPLTVSGGNGYLLWAEDEVFDPITGTTNKAIPITQLQLSGIKPRQPLARQFFNWMIANIDDWFSFMTNRTAVGTIKITDDITKVAGDYDTLYGGTWTARGSEVYIMTAGINPTETVYIFERTA